MLDIELFIDIVKQHEFLYNLGNSDTDKKNSTWEDIAKTANLFNGAVAKGKWRNLWDCYLRYLKRIKTVTGQAKKRQKKWPHADQMEFLKPYITARETHSNIEEEEEPGEEGRESEEEVEEAPNTETSTSTNSGAVARSKRSAPTPRTSTEDVLKYLNEKRVKKSKEEDVDLFFASLAAIVKKLPKAKQARLKLQCSSLVLQAEIDHEDALTNL